MKPILRLSAAAALAGSTLLFHSCASVTAEQTTTARAEHGVPGGEVQQTTQVKATVTAINHATREVTFVTPHDEKLVIKAGPEVANFGQIRVGDQLNVTYVEEVVLRMAGSGEKVDEGSVVEGGRARLGARPGAAVGETTQVTATVAAIDSKRRKVTLRFNDGSSKKIQVRDDIDLSKHKVGEKVVIRYTEAFAIKVDKP